MLTTGIVVTAFAFCMIGLLLGRYVCPKCKHKRQRTDEYGQEERG